MVLMNRADFRPQVGVHSQNGVRPVTGSFEFPGGFRFSSDFPGMDANFRRGANAS